MQPGEVKKQDSNFPKIHSSPLSPEFNPILQLESVKPTIDFRKPDEHKVVKVKSIPELTDFIKKTTTQIRVVGSQHSPADAIYCDNSKGTNLELSGKEFRGINIVEECTDEAGKKFAVIRVGAGCHFGVDPNDKESTQENSLNEWLINNNYSLPILGGITHQSIAGFMQTGSAGGSTFFGFADCIESFKFINGKGEVVTADKGTKIFNAVGVSMGLMGVLIEVTLRVGKIYTVDATEQIVEEKDSWLAPLSDGSYPFQKLMEDKDCEYIHLNWFPQPGVRRVLQWTGKRNDPFTDPDHQRKPYTNLLADLKKAAAAGGLLALIDLIRRQSEIPSWQLQLLAGALKEFLKVNPEATPFRDNWDKILPTENDAHVDDIMKSFFMEIWFPLDQTKTVIDAVKNLYEDPKIALGNYGMEIYCAKKSPFWLSPAYGEKHMIRIDSLWWAYNRSESPNKYFKNFFDQLLKIDGARLHWGKYLPSPGTSGFKMDDLRKSYPKLDEWLEIREQMDPKRIFLTSYWQKIFYQQTEVQLESESDPQKRHTL